MLKTTVGKLLIDQALPQKMRGRLDRVLDKPGIGELFSELATNHADEYKDTAQRLANVARDVAYSSGGMSFGLRHLANSQAADAIRSRIEREIAQVEDDPGLDDITREKATIAILSKYQKPAEEAIFQEALANKNPLAYQVLSGTRGNKTQLKSLIAGDYLYQDNRGNPIAVPALTSYSAGLKPIEYYAAAFGARKGVVDTKLATAQAGFFSKQLGQVSHRLVVTALDADEVPTTVRGLPVDTLDPDNAGALLAKPIGPYARNTVLTARILKHLAAEGHDKILVRSPIVGGPPQGGVYGRDAGEREKGKIAPLGDFVGLAAGQALSEKLTQGQLCLDEDTEVRMADWSTRMIREIHVGDLVLGADIQGRTSPVRVLNVFYNGTRLVRCTTFTVPDQRRPVHLTATADHKILAVAVYHAPAARQVNPYGVLELGMSRRLKPVLVLDDLSTIVHCRYESHEDAGERPTMDLEVDHPDHLFVLANGLIVSNSSKHAGGVAGAAGQVTGFAGINSLVQAPKTMKGGAAHAQLDGFVAEIRDAEQGGKYVKIGGVDHHVAAGQELSVKVNDDVEAGDTLSSGIPNPSEIVKHKGIGEGRRYFTQAFRDAFRNSGMHADRRNVEMLARGLIDHVAIDDEYEDHVPGDITSYQNLEHTYEPREDAKELSPKQAVGKYLEVPVLHHTIGTKIKKSMLGDFAKFHVDKLTVHPDSPPFHPVMIRAMGSLQYDPDFLTRHLGSNLAKGINQAAWRGGESDASGTSFVPAVVDRVHFGRRGLTKGYDPHARDGDGDGKINDGTKSESQANHPPRR